MSRMTDIIRKAQEKTGGSRNLKTIVTQLLYGDLWNEAIADPVLHRQVMRLGYDHAAADFLKNIIATLEENGGITSNEEQYSLWPEPVRQLVKAIDRRGVYVPSAGQYLLLQPDSITPSQTIEAGRHLISHGHDSIQRGNRLIELGNLPWGRPS
jgi:hypothetical protein